MSKSHENCDTPEGLQSVREHCKKIIDWCGKDDGYILAPRSSTDEVEPENLKAMIDFTKEYGIY